MNIDELNKDCPDHDRYSCSDASPINAGIDYRSGTTWCRRCEGLRNIRADARIAELETAMKRQAAAVKMIDMSHVARAETMMQHAQVLHDQSNTAALESERAANALLTERIAELETDLELARRDAGTDRYLARMRFGYAPGDYSGICIACIEMFIGDKRATTCPKCADAAIKADMEARAGNGESGDAGG